MALQLSIVVPTFHEAQNIPVLVRRAFAATRAASLSVEMILVDDNSWDGTREAVEALATEYPVRLITRRNERGLSSAVIKGFEEARGELLMVMDADLSHPPEQIPDVAAPLLNDTADFSLGSRYVSGGSTVDWSASRQINSLVATWLARPLTPVTDPMSGFFCMRRDTWQAAQNVNPIGYKIGLELMVKARCKRIVEVPIVFTDRLHGESKLTNRQRREYIQHLGWLYRFKYPQIWPIGAFAATAALGTALFYLARSASILMSGR